MANSQQYRGGMRGLWAPPPCGTDIDWGNHFARGLSYCSLFNERSGVGAFDLVSKTPGINASVSNTQWVGAGSKRGEGVTPAGGSGSTVGCFVWSDTRIGDVIATGATAQFTVESLVSFNASTLPVNTHILSKNSAIVGGGTAGGWLTRVLTSGSTSIDFVALDSTSAGLNMRATFTSFAVGPVFHLVWVYNKGSATIYINGRSFATGSGTPGSISNTRSLQVGKVTDGLTNPFPGTIYLGRMWANRALSGAEVAELYNDPYGMFLFPGRRLANSKFFLNSDRRRLINVW